MAQIYIYTLTSALHNEAAVATTTQQFLSSLEVDFELKGADFADFGTAPLSLIYVRTGGTEGIFKSLLPLIVRQCPHPIFLLTSGKSNSLAASMEILSYLRLQGMKGEILHGTPTRLNLRINHLLRVTTAHRHLKGLRLGVIGTPSDWLISSHADAAVIHDKLGVDLVEIDMAQVLDAFHALGPDECVMDIYPSCPASASVASALPDAKRLYYALKQVVKNYGLAGFTIRCFDLLTSIHNTGCLALAQLNAEGIVAGCEGDVPAALSMLIAQSLVGVTGFQANPSSFDPEAGLMTLAHCTIPLNLVSRYEFDTHFESGIGVGIRGEIFEGEATLFKVSGDMSRFFIAEGHVSVQRPDPNLCRTQVNFSIDDITSANDYFLTAPIGNHHIVIPGRHQSILQLFMA